MVEKSRAFASQILQLVEDQESQLRDEVASNLSQLMQTLAKVTQDFEAERLEMRQVQVFFFQSLQFPIPALRARVSRNRFILIS